MRQLRVVFASHSSRVDGGAARSLLELVAALKSDGRVEPVVTVPEPGDLAEALRRTGVRWLPVATPLWTPWTPEGFRSPMLSTRLLERTRRLAAVTSQLPAWVAVVRNERPDVVVTSTAAVPGPAVASRVLAVPHLWWLHEFVTRDHGIAYLLGEPLSQRLIGWLSREVVANSEAVAKHFSPPIARAKMRVIYQGIDPSPVGENHIEPGSLRVLLLGRQTPRKGSELALRAVAALKHEPLAISLRLVGPGTPEYRDHLARLAAQLGIADRVELFGFTREPREHFEWSNAVLMCSLHEAFGRGTAEALKSGRPVIGTRSGGTSEIVSDGIDGLLFDSGSVDGLASAIRRLAGDPGLVRCMSKSARDRNGSRFTVEEAVDRFVAVLRQCADASDDPARQSAGRRTNRPRVRRD